MSSALIGIDYTFAGRNPVESERAIDVSIKLKFASFEALVGTNVANSVKGAKLEQALVHTFVAGNYPTDSTDYTDKSGTNNKVGVTKNFLSLITHPPSDTQLEEFQAEARRNGARIYYPNKFRVYLKLGWRIVDSATHTDTLFPASRYEKFVKSINKGEHDKAMLLNLINHELTFNEEGEVELKINYIGSLDTNITSGDTDFIRALYEQKLSKSLDSKVQEEKEILESIEQINKWTNRGCGSVTNDDPIDKKLKSLNEAASKTKTDLEKEKQNALNEVYGEFLSFLLEQGGYKSIQAMTISGDQVKTYAESMSSNERPKTHFEKILKNTPYSRDEALAEAMSDAKNVEKQIIDKGTKPFEFTDTSTWSWDRTLDALPLVDGSGDNMGDLADNKPRIDPSGYNDEPFNQVFKLVSVGSLLDGALQLLEKITDSDFLKTFYVVVGEYYFYPRSDGAPAVRLPIAGLPINFDTFLIWFRDNIVTKQRKNYVLKDFLTDFFTQLVIPSLRGYDSNGKIGRQYSVFFDQKEIKAYEFTDGFGNKKPCISSPERAINNKAVDDMLTTTPPAGAVVKDYNIIYVSLKVSDPDSRGRVFESVQKDREENISHLWVGDTKGMVKSVKFKRIEQPGLKEAKATKE